MVDQGRTLDSPNRSVRVLRYGSDDPLPERRLLRAGPLTAILEGGDLRYVTVGDQEIVRRIYVAVRDRNWDTIAPTYTDYEVHQDDLAFVVRFTAEHRRDEIHFVWDGRIEGTSAGVVTLSMDGEIRSTFLKNRIGFCVLHPMDLAGTPAVVETPNGRVEGAFPTRISPHQPFADMTSIAHPTEDGGQLTIRFAGDLFEMEDQRNWTDASFKTYSTPLRLPYPAEVQAGQRISQRVTLEVRSSGALPEATPTSEALRVSVGTDVVGSMPPIGLGIASHGLALTEVETERLRALQPRHLRVNLDLADDGWEERLRRGVAEGIALGAALQLEVIAGDEGEGLDRLIAALVETQASVQALLVFPRAGHVSTEPVLRRAQELATVANLTAPIGGGARSHFTELNRETPPLELLHVVGYPINAQVHAFDNLSVVETLAGQAATLGSTRAIVGERPVHVGPITLRPPYNPVASGPEPEAGPDELPWAVDPRQLSLFGAGWTVGSIRALAEAGAASLTYYETTGWRGVVERSEGLTRRHLFPSASEQLFPLYHVLADASDFLGSDLLRADVSDPLAVAALAARDNDRLRVLVASFRDEPTTVTLTLPPIDQGAVRFLDETTYEQAAMDGEVFRSRVDLTIEGDSGELTLELRPFAVARLDARLSQGSAADAG